MNLFQRIDIVLPAHNEAATIGQTLREFHAVVAQAGGILIRFVVAEDGSSDNTVAVVQEVAQEIPVDLITGPDRKGYSRAVIDGFAATTSEVVGFIDSDGQCDPADFAALHDAIGDYDLVIGYRNPRADHWVRLLMSGAFACVYRLFFKIPLRDPSCPYLLIKRPMLSKILEGNLGVMRQGFWWEFNARAVAAGAKIKELPVRHRVRSGGVTQVYLPTKVPGIAWRHLLALFSLRSELQAVARLRAANVDVVGPDPIGKIEPLAHDLAGAGGALRMNARVADSTEAAA